MTPIFSKRSSPSIGAVVTELTRKHEFHTLILYGSHARGEAKPSSDFDLLAITAKDGPIIRDARNWRGAYVDLFVYPERKAIPSKLIHARGGIVMKQKDSFGDRLLKRIERLYARGPKPLPADEVTARIVWCSKMLDRARQGDLEANFRRVWLLTALLEDYFVLRNRWYEGPKVSFGWLRQNDPGVLGLFQSALRPNAGLAAIKRVAEAVIAV